MMTDYTKQSVATHLKTTILKGSVGMGGNSTNPASTELDVPLLATHISTVNATSDDNVVDFKLIVSGGNSDIVGRSLREVGFYDSSGNLWARFNFDAIGPFSSSEEVEFILTLEVE